MNFGKKIAIVTGGARGIGREISIQLAKDGYTVIANYNSSKEQAMELEKFSKSNNLSIEVYRADVSKSDQVNKMISDTIEKYKRVDLLVNNAGISLEKLITDTTEDEWDKIFDINLKSVFMCSKAVLKNMIENKSGKIINISSMWGVAGGSYEVVYSATKSGINGFTKALAKEVGPSNINVNAVAPGVIMTDMMKDFSEEDIEALKYETPLMKLGKPSDIANIVSFLASEKADFITGQIINSNGGFVI